MNEIKITTIFIVILGILLSIFVPLQQEGWGENDFLPYWSASKTMLAGGNPYDPNDLLQVQKELRVVLGSVDEVRQAWGPPWMMLLISPLTLIDFKIAVSIWIFCNVVFITLALYLLWGMLFGPSDRKGLIISLGVGYLFGNTIMLINLGQFSSILLIGFVVFIWCLERKFYLWAGLAMLLLVIKPQITYLVVLVIILWAIRNRKWGILQGFFVSGSLLLIILWLIFPNWLPLYINTVIAIPNVQIQYSTIGSFIESIFGISAFKYIGLLLIPLSYPLAKYVDIAGWLTTLNLALLISIPLAPYGFSFDHILLLPAVVQMISWIKNKRLPKFYARVIGIGMVILYLLVIYLMTFTARVSYSWLVWPSVGLSGLYVLGWVKRLED